MIERPIIFLAGVRADYREIVNLVFLEGQDRPDGGLYLELITPGGHTLYVHAARADLVARPVTNADGIKEARVVWLLEDVTTSNQDPGSVGEALGTPEPPEHANCRASNVGVYPTPDPDAVHREPTQDFDPDLWRLSDILSDVEGQDRPSVEDWNASAHGPGLCRPAAGRATAGTDEETL